MPKNKLTRIIALALKSLGAKMLGGDKNEH